MDQRCVAHLDLDAFYATVELQRRPELRGLPVIVSGSGPRAVVTTASYEARKFGVGSAMPTAKARRLCPQAVLVAPDFTAYREVSAKVMALVRATVDHVEVVGLDEAYLDLTGLVAPKAAMRRLVTQIREQTGMSASVGMGPNKLVAKVASDAEKPAGFVVLSREQACARFADRPPKLVPGIGAKTAEKLEALGITTLGQLAACDPQRLAQRFGDRMGPWLVSRARFEDHGAVTSHREAVSESKETTFDVDIADHAKQEEVLRRLAAELCAGLAKHDRTGRTIAIKVRLADFTTITRARTIGEPTADPELVASIAVELLREYAPPAPVRLLGVRVASFARPEDTRRDDAGQLVLPV
ncbi:DNA polymerase IV [Conexibacter sp. SYSU D00693]|uniref:DNA polymerase IV n=1 Tax=Conexibacter sp. SYSU D00693 TaxID=2812560 RepID=UPI00196A758A|nr:DNA polymerase IV [Conexibacter sp. SYSU D00693]